MLILVVIFIGGNDFFNENGATVALVAAIVGFFIGMVVFFVTKKTEPPFVAASILKKTKGAAGANLVFVPFEPGLYVKKDTGLPDINIFKSKSGLKTGVGDTIFVQFILSGQGPLLFEALLAKQALDGINTTGGQG